MHVVVVGCGRVGSSLATRAHRRRPHRRGHRQASRGVRPPGRRASPVRRSPASASTATASRRPASSRRPLLAAVTNGDNSNILIARVARETFGIERVVARIYDPRRAAIYQRLGIPTVATVVVDDRAGAAPHPAPSSGGRVDRPERQGVPRRAGRSASRGPVTCCPSSRSRAGAASWRSAASASPRSPRPTSSPRRATSCTSRSAATPSTRSTSASRQGATGTALMRVVIAGGGSVGRFIAEQLHRAGTRC